MHLTSIYLAVHYICSELNIQVEVQVIQIQAI